MCPSIKSRHFCAAVLPRTAPTQNWPSRAWRRSSPPLGTRSPRPNVITGKAAAPSPTTAATGPIAANRRRRAHLLRSSRVVHLHVCGCARVCVWPAWAMPTLTRSARIRFYRKSKATSESQVYNNEKRWSKWLCKLK